MRDGARLKADVFRPDDGGRFPAILNLGPYQKDKLWVPPPTLEEAANPWMNWETVNPEWWVPRGYAARAGRRARQRQVARPMRAVVARGIDRLVRRDRMGRSATLVQRQCRAVRHFVFRDQSVVRRQPPAAVIEGDHPVGRLRRPLSRRAVPRRDPQRVHDQLVHRAPDASHARPRVAEPARRLADQHAVVLAAQQSRQRRVPRRAGAVGEDHGADAVGRQLDRLRPASARQHRSLHARRLAAQEAAHPQRLARASVLYRGGQARSAALLRLLAQGHRQWRDGRAAGQARDPQGPRRDRVAPRARMAARAHADGPGSISTLRRQPPARSRAPARS